MPKKGYYPVIYSCTHTREVGPEEGDLFEKAKKHQEERDNGVDHVTPALPVSGLCPDCMPTQHAHHFSFATEADSQDFYTRR